jgi:Cof subfamily protein (haloacid dehalogenase superfamily)
MQGILSDFDGTVFDFNHTITDEVQQAIRWLHHQRIPFGFCTGRAFNFIRPHVQALGLDGAHVVCGGAQVVHSDGTILHEDLIPAETMREIAAFFMETDGVLVIKHGEMYGNPAAIEDGRQRRGLLVYPLEELPSWNAPAFYVSHLTEAEWAVLEARTDISLCKQRGHRDRRGFFADGVAPGVSKRTGAAWWCQYHNLDPQHVIGVGDGENDIALFEAVGLGLAVGNAVPELKAVAADIVPSIEENGVAWVINHYFHQD